MDYTQHFGTHVTPQDQKIPGSNQVKNSAGGYSYAVSDMDRLERFLILGSEGGSYYASEQDLTVQNAEASLRCIKADGIKTVEKIVDISHSGRAPKNDPALFLLAMCAGEGDLVTRREALSALPKVARTGTHLFMFLNYVKAFRGWGRSLHRGIQNWYFSKPVSQLAYQMAKYQGRNGWTHRDVFRKIRPRNAKGDYQNLIRWAVKGEIPESFSEDLRIIEGMERAKRVTDAKDAVSLIEEYGLVREMVPTQFLNNPGVWEALLQRMPMTAMIRNLGKMSSIGLLTSFSDTEKLVIERLNDDSILHKARIHPLSVLAALLTYQRGKGVRGSNTWGANGRIVEALDDAFYKAFKMVKPTGKRHMLAIDVSGSMAFPQHNIGRLSNMTCVVGATVMAMVTHRTEPQTMVTAFSAGRPRKFGEQLTSGIQEVSLTSRMRLKDAANEIFRFPVGRTDCALPMIYARQSKIPVDAFVVYTDNETWAGSEHPMQALRRYRETMGIPAKLIVVGMVSNGFSIADPDDRGAMDVVGFDSNAPAVMADFIRGDPKVNSPDS